MSWQEKEMENFNNKDWLAFLDTMDAAVARTKSIINDPVTREFIDMDVLEGIESYPF